MFHMFSTNVKAAWGKKNTNLESQVRHLEEKVEELGEEDQLVSTILARSEVLVVRGQRCWWSWSHSWVLLW